MLGPCLPNFEPANLGIVLPDNAVQASHTSLATLSASGLLVQACPRRKRRFLLLAEDGTAKRASAWHQKESVTSSHLATIAP